MSSSSGRAHATARAAHVLVALVAVCLVLLGPAPGALAHDELTDTDPAAGETLEQNPQELVLSFSGEVTALGARVEVSGPLGSVVDGEPQIEGSRLRQPLSTDAPPGDYEVAWRVTSQDGHPISGTFDYTVLAAGPEAQSLDDAPAEEAEAGGGSESPRPQDSEPTGSDQRQATPGAPVDRADREASTDAVVIESNDPAGAGPALWLWMLVGGAFLALLGVGTLAVRRR